MSATARPISDPSGPRGPEPAPAPPIGPLVAAWRAMTQDQRDAFCQEVIDALNGAPEARAKSRPHRRAVSAALDTLWLHFKSTGRQIYVADDLAVIYPGEPSFAADLLAVLDVPQPTPPRSSPCAPP